MTLFELILAAFLAYEIVLPLLPRLPRITQPVLVYAIAYGLMHVPSQWLIPASVAGGVAIVHFFAGGRPEPAIWPKFSVRRRRPPARTGGIGHRVPGIP